MPVASHSSYHGGVGRNMSTPSLLPPWCGFDVPYGTEGICCRNSDIVPLAREQWVYTKSDWFLGFSLE